MKKVIFLGLAVGVFDLFFVVKSSLVEARESAEIVSEESESEVEEKPSPVRLKKGKRAPREREADGTQAPNRFDQDLIIKSRYELNGQSLEVDTD